MNYLIIILSLFLFSGTAMAEKAKIYGVYEKVFMPEINQKPIKAKLDTGAVTTSLGAAKIQAFKKDGDIWVRFTPQIEGAKELERPLARHSRIKARASENRDDASARRPVVVMDICFDGKKYPTEVNLADRSRFEFPLLLGTTALIEFKAAVDPALEYQSRGDCR